ncbi:hypothetical protein JQ609_31280 [Bradyrhizobium sp. AUGA SZCCT0169]|nr:hypothetical protein [Bradyrhizobium sp. AUGA SZCCT0169]
MPDQAPATRIAVSKNNPCPFLRALVANGYVDGHIVPLGTLTEDIGLASGKTGMGLIRAKVLTYGIAMIANGHPLRSVTSGAILDELRNGPLDKHGAGSRILEVDGQVNLEQIERFASFGQKYRNPDGGTEPGLNAKQIETFMADNLKRDGDKARWTYPIMMKGEWPVLLDILGKGDGETRYLSVAEVRTLFVERRLPERITARLPKPQAGR